MGVDCSHNASAWTSSIGVYEGSLGQQRTYFDILERCVALQVTEFPEAAPPASSGGGEGIVGALMMVMQKRRKTIHSSGKYGYNIDT